VDAIPDSEVEFQEQLIQEREGEIEQIEQGITELNQIFRDLGEIVVGQQSMIGEKIQKRELSA
jgi:t-SNARE complex subunit (syntaxin)